MRLYQVGEVAGYDVYPTVEGYEAACEWALQASEQSDEAVIGVWEQTEDECLLVAIAHQGELFVREM